ncbi:MAG: DUF5677 domain-containing protein [Elusimicrobiota bacterium]|jgi:hypothetical protein|nr:DUF5677 domain-containing protein [Elusimicrobiota bacterium]
MHLTEDMVLKITEEHIKTFRDKIQIQLNKEIKKRKTSKQYFTHKIIEFVLAASDISINDSLDILLIKTRKVMEALIYLKWSRKENQYNYFMYRSISDNINFWNNASFFPFLDQKSKEIGQKRIEQLEAKLNSYNRYKAPKKPNWQQMAEQVKMGTRYKTLYKTTSTLLHCSDFILVRKAPIHESKVMLAEMGMLLEAFKYEVDETQSIPNSDYVKLAK